MKVIKKKPIKKKTIKNRLDKLWSSIVHQKGKCEVCGKTSNLNSHHLIGRRNLSTRWDLRNACLLCPACHTFGNNSAHQNPIWFDTWLEDKRPDDRMYLKQKSKESPKPYSIKELLEIEEELKQLKTL